MTDTPGASPNATLGDLVRSKGYVVADGAMGTQLFAAGLSAGWSPEEWNLSHPDEVRAVHRGYLQAGADLIVTNSFGGNCFRQSLHGFEHRVRDLNLAAAQIGRGEADAETQRSDRPVLVAGSMGPTGELLAPLGDMSVQACEAAFGDQAAALHAGGVDLLWIETMSALDEAEAAVRAARRVCDLPVAVTMSFDTAGCTMMGVTADELAERLGAMELAAFGANCGSNVPDTEAAVAAVARAGTGTGTGTLVVSKPNAGVPVWRGDTLVYDGTPELLAAHAHRVHTAGVSVVGSCCGSTPAHTQEIAAVLAGDKAPSEVEVAPNPEATLDERLVRRRPRRGRDHG